MSSGLMPLDTVPGVLVGEVSGDGGRLAVALADGADATSIVVQGQASTLQLGRQQALALAQQLLDAAERMAP